MKLTNAGLVQLRKLRNIFLFSLRDGEYYAPNLLVLLSEECWRNREEYKKYRSKGFRNSRSVREQNNVKKIVENYRKLL